MTKFECPEEGCDYTLTYNDKKASAVKLGAMKIAQHKRSHEPPIKERGWKFKPYQDGQCGTINTLGHMGTATLKANGQEVKVSFGQVPEGILISVSDLGDFVQDWDTVLRSVKPALTKALGGDVCQVCAGLFLNEDDEGMLTCQDCGNTQEKVSQ